MQSEGTLQFLETWLFRSKEAFYKDLESINAHVGPRTGPDSRNHAQRERYCLRSYLIAIHKMGKTEFPFSVNLVAAGEGPDFKISLPNEAYGLEVTEAGNENHQRMMTTQLDDEVLLEEINPIKTASEIGHSIERKMKKGLDGRYAVFGVCDLLIYENTEGSGLHESDDFEKIFAELKRTKSSPNVFRHIDVIFPHKVVLDVLGNARDFPNGTQNKEHTP